MAKRLIVFALLTIGFFQKTLAWGPEGHAIVGKLAMHFVNKDAREAVLKTLNGMPMDTVANWMDIMKSNADCDLCVPGIIRILIKGKPLCHLSMII